MQELLAIPPGIYTLCPNAGDEAFGSTHDSTLACILMIANDFSFYSWGSVKNSHAADDSLTYWNKNSGQEIGKPPGNATKDGYAYHRDFEHDSFDVTLKTKTSSIVWKRLDSQITPPD